MHFIPLTAPERAIGSNEQFTSLSPRGTSGERVACLPRRLRRRQGERGIPYKSSSSPLPSLPSAVGRGSGARLFLAGALLISCVQIATAADGVQNASSAQTKHHAGSREMELRGRVVCLPEEMHRIYQTDLPTNHEHIYGFKTTN